MNDPTTTLPSPLHRNLPARTDGESQCVASSAGSGEELPGSLGGTTADADRRNAIARQKILDAALMFAVRFRLQDDQSIKDAAQGWDDFTAAVDELAGAK